jgi:hypothetical protein
MHRPDRLPLEEASLKITRWFGNCECRLLRETLALMPEVGSTKTLTGVSVRNDGVEHRRSGEPSGYSYSQEITLLLRNTKVITVLRAACL